MANENITAKETLNEMWQGLSNTLQQTSELVEDATKNADSIDRAEGYRHTLRLLHHAMGIFIEDADPLRPYFTRVMTPTVKYFGDNPDVYYDRASINGKQGYRIKGKRGTVTYLGFIIYRRSRNNRIASNINVDDSIVGPDGTFEIILSPEEQDGNWFQLDPLAWELVARQYFLDMDNEIPATYEIECLGENPKAPPFLSDKQLAKGVSFINRFIPSALERCIEFTEDIFRNPNEFIPYDPLNPIAQLFSPTSDNQYVVAAFQLQQDEAMVITVKPPDTIYWSIQLWNRWFESLDFRYHQVIINKHQAHLEPDGTFSVIVALQNPGMPNWLDTAGHKEGLVCFRWMLCEENPEPKCKVVKLNEL